tara:strand:+ start:287 stop:2494 length:2208 start_codon:yes stop_codon:yes gene_type:complete
VIKLGGTSNPVQRDPTYKTGEPDKGNYLKIFEVSDWETVENLLQDEFKEYHYDGSGGSEFYEFHIIHEIEDTLTKLGFEYKEVDISEINRKSRTLELRDRFIKKLKKNASVKKYRRKLEELKRQRDKHLTKRCLHERTANIIQLYHPTELQEPIVNNIFRYFEENDKGRLILPPGVGKTLISLFSSRGVKANKICVGIPSLPLVSQWKDEILKIYPGIPILGICTNNYNEKWITLNDNKIKEFLEKNEICIVIVLYSSCNKLLEIVKRLPYTFDFKVGDECHHLTGEYDEYDEGNVKKYTKFHDIPSKKSLFMTGTSKTIENNTDKVICSMDDANYFGEIIYERNIKWAIENKMICDYKIILLRNTDEEIEMIARKYNINIEGKSLNLFLSAYMTLKSLMKYGDITHVFCYTNNINSARVVDKYISILIDKHVFKIDKTDIYHKSLNSESLNSDGKMNIKDEINSFTKKKYGIISCVYMFGEGFNLPPLNAVVFAENMNSEIRTIQSMTRCLRKDKNKSDKVGHVIIPFLDVDEWGHNGESFQKVRNIIYHIRNNDSNVEQRIKLSISKMREPESPTTRPNVNIDMDMDHFIDYDEDDGYLNKLRLRIRKSTSGNTKTLLEEEYEYIRERNSSLNLSSKSEYFKSDDKDDFISEPEDKYKIVWKGWYHFLNCDTKRFISDKDEWINECKKNNINSLDEYYELCDRDNRFPIDASEFYDCGCISVELNFKNNKRRR